MKRYILFFWFVKPEREKQQAKNKMWGVETKWWRLGDIGRGTETVSRGLEAIQRI